MPHWTVCFKESDRAIVQGNIVAFMKFIDLVPAGADDVDALAAFNSLVRRDLPHALSTSIGWIGLPYFRFVIVLSTLAQLPTSLDRLVEGGHSSSVRGICLETAFCITVIFGILPLSFAVVALLSTHVTHHGNQAREVVRVVCIGLFGFAVSTSLMGPAWFCMTRGRHSWTYLGLLIAYIPVVLSMTHVYRAETVRPSFKPLTLRRPGTKSVMPPVLSEEEINDDDEAV